MPSDDQPTERIIGRDADALVLQGPFDLPLELRIPQGYRADVIVEGAILPEPKAVERGSSPTFG